MEELNEDHLLADAQAALGTTTALDTIRNVARDRLKGYMNEHGDEILAARGSAWQ